jgi:hypothetical protein
MSLAAEAFVEAAAALGLSAHAADHGPDLVMLDVHGTAFVVAVKSRATVSDAQLATLPPAGSADVLHVLVADRLLASGRAALDRLGWSWLDLRGHLRLVGPGVHVDAEVPPFRERPARTRALSGAAGVEVACELMLTGEPGVSVRSLARAVGRAPSTVSEVLKALRAEDLLTARDEVAVPELFREVAAVWHAASADVATVRAPSAGDAALAKSLRLGMADSAKSGWALTDTMAAADYGAPVVVASGHPHDFYVPDKVTFRRAQALLPVTDSSPAATIRVAPVPAVCTRREDGRTTEWPLAHPLFVALDLAQDAGRGREILEQWTPREWRRVW